MTKHQHEPEPTVAEVPSDTRVIEEFPRAMFKAVSAPPPVEATPAPVIVHGVAQSAEEQAALEADGYHTDLGAALAAASTAVATAPDPKPAPEPRRHYNER